MSKFKSFSFFEGYKAFFQIDLSQIPTGQTNTFNVYLDGILYSGFTTTGRSYLGTSLPKIYFSPLNGQQVKCEHITTSNSYSQIDLGLGFDKRCYALLNSSNNLRHNLCDTWSDTNKFTGGVNYFKFYIPASGSNLNCTSC